MKSRATERVVASRSLIFNRSRQTQRWTQNGINSRAEFGRLRHRPPPPLLANLLQLLIGYIGYRDRGSILATKGRRNVVDFLMKHLRLFFFFFKRKDRFLDGRRGGILFRLVSILGNFRIVKFFGAFYFFILGFRCCGWNGTGREYEMQFCMESWF